MHRRSQVLGDEQRVSGGVIAQDLNEAGWSRDSREHGGDHLRHVVFGQDGHDHAFDTPRKQSRHSLASFVGLDADLFGAVSFDGPLATGSLGLALPSGMDEAALAADLTLGGSVELVYNAVPEPGTLALLAMGLIGMLVWRRRK